MFRIWVVGGDGRMQAEEGGRGRELDILEALVV
jgi:hypothetical protein